MYTWVRFGYHSQWRLGDGEQMVSSVGIDRHGKILEGLEHDARAYKNRKKAAVARVVEELVNDSVYGRPVIVTHSAGRTDVMTTLNS